MLVHSRDGGPRSFTADQVFINAGTRPSVPALDGLNEVAYLDSTSIMELDTVPEHLLVNNLFTHFDAQLREPPNRRHRGTQRPRRPLRKPVFLCVHS